MPKLSEEQIVFAEQLCWKTWASLTVPETTREGAPKNCRIIVEVLAPHLQYPLEEPTPQEVVQASDHLESQLADNEKSYCTAAAIALKHFIDRRNAARQPQPDPRREAVRRGLYSQGEGAFSEPIIDAILAELDKVKT